MADDPILLAARAALSRLTMPGGASFLDAPEVSGPVMSNGRISVSILTTAEAASSLAPLRAEAEAALRALPGGEGALVMLTNDTASPPRLKPVMAEPKPAAPKPLADVRHVVAVASGKGGVGKSTTAVNLALGLRAQGLKVGILDADIHGPSIPTLLALHGQPRMGTDRRLLPMQSNGLSAMSMGMMVDAETAMVWRGPMVMSAITQMLSDVDWGVLDVLIVDMPPGTGDAQLAIAQGTTLSGAVIVSTPQDLALIDARRGIAMFGKVDVPILGLIENMAHFTCTECGAEHALFGTGGAESEARRLCVPFLGAVPLTIDLRAASDSGQPIVARDPNGPIGRLYTDMAAALWTRLSADMPTIQPNKKLQGA